ncbi:hypothetical protein [Phocaeicola plebeius]|jgi:hypothetical protein
MKVYIKKPWKEILIWGFVSPSVMYMFIEIYSKQIIIKLAITYLIIVYALAFLVWAIYFNYLILYDNRIVLKNRIYRFWSRTFMYQDIEKIMIKDDLGQYNYVYFQFVSNGKKSHKYLVSSIDHRHDLKQITEELLRKKINVEVSESVVARFFNDVN